MEDENETGNIFDSNDEYSDDDYYGASDDDF
jgi:hypothetical protein